MLKINELCFSYQSKDVLKNVNLNISQPGLYCVTGKSGSGKTTLLNLIAGFLEPNSGEIVRDSSFTYCLVDDMNIDSMSVEDNLSLSGASASQIDVMLSSLWLASLKRKRVSKLSKGEQARVSIGRSLLCDNEMVLLDEPTGNLDLETAEQVFKTIAESSKNKIIIVATHDVDLAKKFAQITYKLEDGKLARLSENSSVCEIADNIEKRTGRLQKLLLSLKYATTKSLKSWMYYLNSVVSVLSVILFFMLFASTQFNLNKTAENLINNVNCDVFALDSYQEDTLGNSSLEASQFGFIQGLTLNIRKTAYFGEKNAVFYSDVKEYLTSYADLDSIADSASFLSKYPSFEVNNINSAVTQVRYYPCYVTSESDKYEIEDVVSLYLDDLKLLEIRLVIMDIVDIPVNIASNHLDFVISDKLLKDYCDILGFVNFGSISASLYSSYLEDFQSNEYYSELYNGSNTLVNIDSKFIKSLQMYDEGNLVPGYICFGKKPEAGEFLCFNKDTYLLLTGDDTYLTAEEKKDKKSLIEDGKSFASKHPEGYKVSLFKNRNYDFIDNLEITLKPSGYIGYFNGSEIINPFKADCFVINEELADELSNLIEKEGYSVLVNTSGYKSYLGTKLLLTNKRSEILNGEIVIQSLPVTEMLSLSKSNLIKLSLWFCLPFLVILGFTSYIYIHTSIKSMKKNTVVLRLSNWSNNEIYALIGFWSVFIILPGLIGIPLGLIFSQYFFGPGYIGGAPIVDSFASCISINIALPVCLSLAFMCLYGVIALLFSIRNSRKGILKKIKK